MTTPRISTPSAPLTVAPRCAGVRRVALRSADLARARDFYVGALGFPLLMETQAMFVVLAGETPIDVHGPASGTSPDDAFDPARVGLEHLVLGCDDVAEVARIAASLAERGVDTGGGVVTDELLGRRFVAFRDPDGIRWEVSTT